MPNSIGPNGLTISTRQEILDALINGVPGYPGMVAIFGPNVNVGPNTPDGNLLNLVALVISDTLELLAQVNASFDPDQAVGTILDSRAAINGVTRQGATYTIQNVQVSVDRALTLPGLDTSTPFTVADSSGNQFNLITSYAFGAAGDAELSFQAANIGPVQTTIGTILNVVTPQLGVTTVNNDEAATIIGLAQETDAAFRARRARSVSLPSQGFIEGLTGALIDIEGVKQAIVLENITNAVDANGIPAHGIWAIVDADSSLNAEIAQVIYVKRNAGADMKGAISVPVARPAGPDLDVLFDHPTVVNPWIKFSVAAVTGTVDVPYIRNQLLILLKYTIGQIADVTTIVALVKQIAPNAVVTSEGVSLTDSAYTSTLAAPTVDSIFVPITTQIKINGAVGP